jgi:hypothetical protein
MIRGGRATKVYPDWALTSACGIKLRGGVDLGKLA